MNVSQIPKIELHCHLDGIISPGIVREIVIDHPDYPVQVDDFAAYLPVTDYESFVNWWQVSDLISGQLELYKPVLKQYLGQLKAQNVHYLELFVAAGELPSDVSAAIDAMQAFREWVNQEEAGQIQVEFLVAINRARTPESIKNVTEITLALYEKELVCGIAYAGPEKGHSVEKNHAMFAQFHEAGIGIEIHAGEWVGAESVRDALTSGFPDRIGHGVNLFQDERLIEIFQERQIHIEFCPTSNVKTGSINTIEAHPIQQARAAGLNFGISTDDPGPFECSMNSEYQLMVDTFGFTESDFQRIYDNCLNARFGKSRP